MRPQDFDITNFRNDLYRSIGGFLRVYDVLKRGKTLEDTLFFEFRWGYFVWLHRSNKSSISFRSPHRFRKWSVDRQH